MYQSTLPPCSGTVVVHRDEAVTCTIDTCRRDLPRGTWFSLHDSFVYCPEWLGVGRMCPDCGFSAPEAARLLPSSPRIAAQRGRRGHRYTEATRSWRG